MTCIDYHIIDSPIGPLLLASTPVGLIRVAFSSEGFDAVLTALTEATGATVRDSPDALTEASEQFSAYFSGTRRDFDLPLDHSLAGKTGSFRRTVQDHLPQIPYGTTRTYGQVAAAVGKPAAVRAVGSACATNPLPVVVPCHRVLRSDGRRGGYLGGPAAKALLLDLESRA